MSYRAPRWLPGGHAQTIWPLTIKGRLPEYRRERWTTPDHDFIDLDWLDGPRAAPLVCLLHGLEGSSRSHYARQLMHGVQSRAWRGVVVHFRGCSGEPNRAPRGYHSGDSGEIDWILRRLAGDRIEPLFVAGYSLGGNVLLKWLAEQGAAADQVLCAGAAISAPHDLALASRNLARGANRIYTRYFLRSLIPRAFDFAARHPGLLDPVRIGAVRTLEDYDNAVTAPLHGFRDAADYYARSSAKPLLAAIRTPVLVLNAINDPFLPAHGLPTAQGVSSAVCLELPAEGGHVGFVAERFPGRLDWLARRVLDWFAEFAR